jgi:predicted deacylase
MDQQIIQPPLPQFEVRVSKPDIAAWLPGNTGVKAFTTRDSGQPGLHVALIALIHGNEIAGAIAMDKLLRGGLAPVRGRLTFGFANIAAFARFDPRQPTASRFLDEDLNRLWDLPVLNGPRHSCELSRAREMRPLIDTVDVLLDLHSMLWPSEPLTLCGSSVKGRHIAFGIGVPELVVADHGHASGRRMIDYQRFVDPDTTCAAILVEAGQHWEAETVEMTIACVAGLLHHLRLIDDGSILPPERVTQRFAEVTTAVTANTTAFSFVQPFRGGEVIARRNTLIAMDGAEEIRTPHDNCLLVMPSLRPSRGHTAVRLARFRS